MSDWQNILKPPALPPDERDQYFPLWLHVFSLLEDTTAQLSTLAVNYGKNPNAIRNLLTDLSQDRNKLEVLAEVWQFHTLAMSDQHIRLILQNALSKVIKRFYPNLENILPKQWGSGHRIIDAEIGLI